MSGQRRGSGSLAVGSKPEELEEAWRWQCKYSAAGSRRAACKYSAATMPPSLWDFAEGGPYYKADPPLKPMHGADFEKWRSRWEQEQAWKHAWEKKHAWEGEGSSSGRGGGDEEEAAEEGEDPLFLEAVAASKKEAAGKARKEEATAAIAAVNELIAREAVATTPVVNLDD
jgi:hypothetical protein